MFFNSRAVGLSVLTVLVAAVGVVAQLPNPITEPTAGSTVTAGSTFTISWTPTTNGTISLFLKNGDTNDLNTISTIASGIANSGTFAWSVDTSVPAGTDYAIEISAGSSVSDDNFSPRFTIDSSVTATTGESTASATVASGSSTSGSSTSYSATTTTSSSTSASSSTPTSSTPTSITASLATATPPPVVPSRATILSVGSLGSALVFAAFLFAGMALY